VYIKEFIIINSLPFPIQQTRIIKPYPSEIRQAKGRVGQEKKDKK